MPELSVRTNIFKKTRPATHPWVVEMVERPSGDILVVDTETYEEASYIASELYQLADFFCYNLGYQYSLCRSYLWYAGASRGGVLTNPVNFWQLTLHVENNLRYSYFKGATEIEEFTDEQA